MSCSSWRPLLSAHLDGRLAPQRQAALVAHLGSCAACAAEVAAWREAGAALRALEVPPIPADLAARAARAALTAAPPSFSDGFVFAGRRAAAFGTLVCLALWGAWLVSARIDEPPLPDEAAFLAAAGGEPSDFP